jgi:mRNA-degrading endonuclease RelE of RelBE toxin-antitoxin system
MAYVIVLGGSAGNELRSIRPYDQRRIVDELNKQLQHQPTSPSRNRKRLDGIMPSFEHVPPLWELRVGEYRVFYDVEEANNRVVIRALRKKERGQTTEDLIHERNDS